jgi:hypothetical protein
LLTVGGRGIFQWEYLERGDREGIREREMLTKNVRREMYPKMEQFGGTAGGTCVLLRVEEVIGDVVGGVGQGGCRKGFPGGLARRCQRDVGGWGAREVLVAGVPESWWLGCQRGVGGWGAREVEVVGCWKLDALLCEREHCWRAHLRVGEVVGQSEETESPGISGSPSCQV